MTDEINKHFLDAVAKVNLMVTAAAPSVAMGSIYISAANSAGLSFHSAAQSQQLNFMLASATAVKGVNKILDLNIEKDVIAISKLNE